MLDANMLGANFPVGQQVVVQIMRAGLDEEISEPLPAWLT